MDATDKGVKDGRQFRHSNPVLFESMTRDGYRTLGETKAKQVYASQAKQAEFVQGWIAVNQQFFQFLADGPRRRVSKVCFIVECMKCGTEEEIEIEGDGVEYMPIKYKSKPCPVCQEEARCTGAFCSFSGINAVETNCFSLMVQCSIWETLLRI